MNYSEMTRRVLERRDREVALKKRRTKSLATGLSCIMMGAVIWRFAIVSEAESGIDDLKSQKEDTPYLADNAVEDGDFQKMWEKTPDARIETLPNGGHYNSADVEPNSDEPVEGNYTGALTAVDGIWGGCCMENGRWVVWLTDDSAENREKVFSANPGLSRENTEFKRADYSYYYLEGLMADISSLMAENGVENVTTAALREDINRVVVTMSVENEDDKEALMALDSQGAIVIEVAEGNASVDLVQIK